MPQRHFFKRLFTSFSNRFFMPRAFRDSIAEKNCKRTIFGLIFTILASIIGELILIIASRETVKSYEDHMLFLNIYIVTALIASFILIIIKKKNSKNPFLNELPLYMCGTVGTLDCLYSLLHQTGVFNALVFFLFLEIIISLVFTIEPIFFFILTLISYLQFYPNIVEEYGGMAAYTTMLLFAVLIILCMYKWMNTKRLLIREQNFDLYKEALQSEVDRQMDEITIQHKKIIKMQNHTIISLSNLVENRDSDTGQHVRRTSKYVRILAEQALKDGYYPDIITDDFIQYLYKAAPMHDIGKIVVSDIILKKPGKLTDEEFLLMQKHTIEGGKIVKDVLGDDQEPDYVTIASNIATYHHEKWDGNGYPAHLKGNDIPVSARIMAIADVFDALVSPRCYKAPFPAEKAFSIIKEDAGTHFDPILAEEFLKIKEPVLKIMHELSD